MSAAEAVFCVRAGSAPRAEALEAARRLRGAPSVLVRDDEGAGTPARARNRALQGASSRFVLLLDGDAEPAPDALEALRAAAERAGACAALPRVLAREGLLQHGPARMSWAALPRFHGWWGSPSPGESRGWSAGGGTAMLIDRARLPAGTLFDESFGPCLEDADFLYRAALAGGGIVFAPAARVLHLNPALAEEARGARPYPPEKMRLQSRNRRLLALKSFSASTLALSAPLQLAVEAATAALAARDGLLGEYMRGWSETWVMTPAALRQRSAVQRARRVPDRRLLAAGAPSARPSARVA